MKSPRFLIVISTRPSMAAALDENENGCPVILKGLPHSVSQPNWPGLKRKPGWPSGLHHQRRGVAALPCALP